MIFRRYRTWLCFLIIASIVVIGVNAMPYVSGFPVFSGLAQGAGASYPLKSADRVLINLNGNWQAFNSLQAASTAGTVIVQTKVYGGIGGSDRVLPVPGSWTSPVAVTQFFLNNELSGRNFRLDFLRLGSPAEVFVNGFSASGQVPPSSVPFSIDIPAPYLKFGAMNTVTIKLAAPAPNGPWLPFPGLTGEVYLEALNTIAMDVPLISTKLNGDLAELTYRIHVSDTASTGTLTGQVSLIDSKGTVVASDIQTFEPKASQVLTGKLVISQPKLWNLQDPYLYQFNVTLTSTLGDRDSYSIPLGLRELRIQGRDLILNGEKLQPKVLLRVNDAPVSGGAGNPQIIDKDLAWAKNKGYNVLLIPDGPPHPYLLDAADRKGLLVLFQSQAAGLTGTALLQQGTSLQTKIQELYGYHPSFLAQGLGSGLDLRDSKVKQYLEEASDLGDSFYTVMNQPDDLLFTDGGELKAQGPYLADYLSAKPSVKSSSFEEAHVQAVGLLSRQRVVKSQRESQQGVTYLPNNIFIFLAAAAVVLILRSWGLGSLRFADLTVAKPRRKLRRLIRNQFYWYLLRIAAMAVLASDLLSRYSSEKVLDALVESIPSLWLQNLVWSLSANPVILALTLFCLGLALSWFLALPRSRTLPGRPNPVSLVLWTEKRKRWIVLVLGLWIFALYGGPFWPTWLALVLGLIYSFVAIARDLRIAGGKTFNLYYLTVFFVLLMAIVGFNWDKLIYFYHWSKL